MAGKKATRCGVCYKTWEPGPERPVASFQRQVNDRRWVTVIACPDCALGWDPESRNFRWKGEELEIAALGGQAFPYLDTPVLAPAAPEEE